LANHDQRGDKNPNWRGGVILHTNGYWYIYKPDYHRAQGVYAKRADLVMEEKLGRLLQPNEVVHHKNRDTTDDSVDNLEVMDDNEHCAERNRAAAKRGAFKDAHILQNRDAKGKFSK
jgi:hypothetical protein